VIKKPAARIAASVFLIGGLAFSRFMGDGDVHEMLRIDPIPHPDPVFRIHWQPGHLSLSGHTQSEQHERDLQQIAASTFSSVMLETDFVPLGVVPEKWPELTAQTLYLLAETEASTAELSGHTIDIRGITANPFRWQSRLNAVRQSLPADIQLAADTITIDPSIDAGAICQRAFENFDVGPINFEESTAVFRDSAYPRLQRIIALASTCHESHIAITGHTDASGSESYNERLSLERAKAVGDYLVEGGIETERLLISGLGSAQPIADNGTRYGRSLNRRIEIEFNAQPGNDALLGRR
jgi:outer membrane protein OmpA-like peptidoglycan-associated protein